MTRWWIPPRPGRPRPRPNQSRACSRRKRRYARVALIATLIDLYSQYRLNAIANQAHLAGATTAPHTGAVISTQVVAPVRSSSRRWTGRLATSAFSIYPPQESPGADRGRQHTLWPSHPLPWRRRGPAERLPPPAARTPPPRSGPERAPADPGSGPIRWL